jgi:hypothetical protein
VLVHDKAEHKEGVSVDLQVLRTEPNVQQLSTETTAFWNIAVCSIVEVEPGDGGSMHLLKHQFTLMRLHSAIPQKTVIFILATVKT